MSSLHSDGLPEKQSAHHGWLPIIIVLGSKILLYS